MKTISIGQIVFGLSELQETRDKPMYLLQSWVCAGRECFFTWAFLGPVLVQLASHNRWRHRVIRDTTLVVVVPLAVLVLSGLLGVAITHMLNPRYQYTVSSFGE